MKADITRRTFRAEKHYNSVRQQQGRVQLDAEWNEQFEILAHLDRATAVDVIGKVGVPKGDSFKVSPSPDGKDLVIAPGHLYVDGILCELEPEGLAVASFPAANQVELPGLRTRLGSLAAGQWIELSAVGKPARIFRVHTVDATTRRLTFAPSDDARTPFTGVATTLRRAVSYVTQPDDPRPADTTWPASGLPTLNPSPGTYAVYLDVWERAITALDDPEIREVALGGPDTTTRSKTIWQLRLHRAGGVAETVACGVAIPAASPPSGKLAARAKAPSGASTPCVIAPGAGYRRLENQLYRVEVHAGGDLGGSGVTFKWSRDNGAIAASWDAQTTNNLTVSSPGKDRVVGFARGQWIELTDDNRELHGQSGTLVRIDRVDENVIVVDAATATGSINRADFALNPKVRRWDSPGAVALARPSANGGWLALEDGVEIRFEAGSYGSGDHWLVPARVHKGDVEWPREADGTPIPEPRHGVRHHVAALAIARFDGTTFTVLNDCRPQFEPLTEHDCEQVDLAHHNKHLHGYGVVCGLKMHCLDASSEIPHPRRKVILTNGYAIDPDGQDLKVSEASGQRILPIVEMAADAGIIKKDGEGGFSDGAVSVYIDRQGVKVEAYDPDAGSWAKTFEGTFWVDFYKDCIENLWVWLQNELKPPAGNDGGTSNEPVSEAQKRLTTFLNLIWHLVDRQYGHRVFLSGDLEPSQLQSEHSILRSFYLGLRAMLQSETFCAMYDGVEFPEYDVRREGAPKDARPSTIFGKGFHTRLRLHPNGKLAYTVGRGDRVHVFDLASEKMIAEVPFPASGARISDVCFSPTGSELYAVGQIGEGKKDTMFAVASIDGKGVPTFTTNTVICDVQLVTLGSVPALKGNVYAVGLGDGLYLINPTNVSPTPSPVSSFNAVGHMVIAERGKQVFAYCTAYQSDNTATAKNITTTYNYVFAIELSKHQVASTYYVPGSGHDDIAVAFDPQKKVDYLYVVGDPSAGSYSGKRILSYNFQGEQITEQSLFTDTELRLGFCQQTSMVFVSAEDQHAVYTLDPHKLQSVASLHPVQIGPCSLAVAPSGQRLYVLNYVSNTITVIPTQPVESVIDLQKLTRYRVKVINAFLGLLGRFAQYLKDCFCEHFLINCPDATGKKVYLGSVSIKDSKVYQICNFSRRRYVHTFPAVEYWLSLVPVLPAVRKLIGEFCCTILPDIFGQIEEPNSDNVGRTYVKSSYLRHGAGYLEQANLAGQLRAQWAKLNLVGLVGGTFVDEKLKTPPTMVSSNELRASDVIGRKAEDVSLSAKDLGAEVTVRRLSENRTAVELITGLIAPARVLAGDRIEVLTDAEGVVRSYARAPRSPGDVQAVELRREVESSRAAVAELRKAAEDGQSAIAAVRSAAGEVASLRASLSELDQRNAVREREAAELKKELESLRVSHTKALDEVREHYAKELRAGNERVEKLFGEMQELRVSLTAKPKK